MLAAGRLRVFAGPPKSRAAEGVLSLSKCPLLYMLPRRRWRGGGVGAGTFFYTTSVAESVGLGPSSATLRGCVMNTGDSDSREHTTHSLR